MSADPRPSVEEYKMALAVEVASRSNCFKTQVGAILLREDRVRAVGYNGTVEGFPNCFDGGCPRCSDERIRRGEQLDRCICVHGEENALVSAARYGIPIADTECYVTHEPCLSCTKLLIQARVSRVVYLNVYEYAQDTDHSKSRQQMRDSVRTGTRFEPFLVATPESRREAAAEQVEVWTERAKSMRRRLRDYAIAKGVTKPRPESAQADPPKPLQE